MAAILARIILGERPARIWYPATGLALAGLVLLNLGSSQDTSTAALLLPLLAPDLLDDLPPPALDQILGLLAGMLCLPF